MPPHPVELLRVVAARLAAGARHTPTAKGAVRTPSGRSQARAPV
jgi:hypothetical protein